MGKVLSNFIKSNENKFAPLREKNFSLLLPSGGSAYGIPSHAWTLLSRLTPETLPDEVSTKRLGSSFNPLSLSSTALAVW